MAVGMNLYTDLQNVARSMDIDVELLEVDTHDSDLLSVHVHPFYERPEQDFQISRGIVLPKNVGYSFTQWTARANTSPRRKLATDTTYVWGTFYSGHKNGISVNVSARPAQGYSFSADYQWNRVELKQGNFTTTLYRATVNSQLSPFTALSNSIQYDNISRVLGWQSRLRLILKPGKELYAVYSHNWVAASFRKIVIVGKIRGVASEVASQGVQPRRTRRRSDLPRPACRPAHDPRLLQS